LRGNLTTNPKQKKIYIYNPDQYEYYSCECCLMNVQIIIILFYIKFTLNHCNKLFQARMTRHRSNIVLREFTRRIPNISEQNRDAV